MNALKPMTPRSASSSMRSRLTGVSPPQRAKSTRELRLGRVSFGVEGRTVERWRMGIEGHLGHGRRAADCAGGRAGCPSFPIRPTWLIEVNMDVDDARKDMQPSGIDLLARRSPRSRGTTSTISPSLTATSAMLTSVDVTTAPPRTRRSNRVIPLLVRQHGDEPIEHVDRGRDVARQHRLRRVMADAAGATDEEHGDRHDLGHHHGVVPGAGGEPLDRQPRGRDCLC